MGSHATVYSFSENDSGGEDDTLYVDDNRKYFFTESCDLTGQCRVPFWDSMFSISNSGIELINYPDGDYEDLCLISSKKDCIRNFLKFSSSKVNPFRFVPYYKQAEKQFQKNIKSVRGDYLFYFLSDVIYPHLPASFLENNSKFRKFIENTILFYDYVRMKNSLIKDDKVINTALLGTMFQLNNGKIDLRADNEKERKEILEEELKGNKNQTVAKLCGDYY